MSEMFGNGICDIECNNTLCSYDVGECVVDQYSSINISQLFGYNATYCDDDTNTIANACEIDWIDDGWCDDDCRKIESCFYDANDCSNVDNYCRKAFDIFDIVDDATTNQGDYYLSFTGFCDTWNTLAEFCSVNQEFIQEYIDPYNCTTAFDMIDKDNNTYIDLYEFIYIVNAFQLVEVELTETKYQQINCSSCLETVFETFRSFLR